MKLANRVKLTAKFFREEQRQMELISGTHPLSMVRVGLPFFTCSAEMNFHVSRRVLDVATD